MNGRREAEGGRRSGAAGLRLPSPVSFLPLLFLAGCGFHLAGTRPLPPALESVHIDLATPYRVSKPPLEPALRARLIQRGAAVAKRAGDAGSVLRLTELTESRDVLSVDPFGKAVEYRLSTRVNYALLDREGRPLVPAGALVVSRDYSFNAQQLLAKEAEEARMQEFMQKELADVLLLRLVSLLSQPAAAPPVPPAPPAAAPAAPADATPEP